MAFFFVSFQKLKLSPRRESRRRRAADVSTALPAVRGGLLQHNCKMADNSSENRINLAALKRVDPYAVEILETGTQVAIYKFSNQTTEWVSSVINPPTKIPV